jgi:Holliday junction resolvase RusA-like endonuclease
MDGRYSVTVDVWERDGRRGDVDNLAKNVLDSCNRVLWDDDRQVDQLGVVRHSPDKANPRTVVRVEWLP